MKTSEAIGFLRDCIKEFGDLDVVNVRYDKNGGVIVEHGMGFLAMSIEDTKTGKMQKYVAFSNVLARDDGEVIIAEGSKH